MDLVAQGDSVYDIIDASDHLITRTNLSAASSLETGKTEWTDGQTADASPSVRRLSGALKLRLSADRLFRCRFNTSKSVRRQSTGNKLVLIRARCLSLPPAASSYWTSNPIWVCFCCPLDPHPTRSGPGAEKEPGSAPPPADANLFLACFHSQHARDLRLQSAQDR